MNRLLITQPEDVRALRQHMRCSSPNRERVLEGLQGALNRGISHNSSLQHTASLLCVSPRTLSRRLQQLGTSYRERLAEARKAQALTYLKNPDLRVGEISQLLGYQNTSNFIKAFKEWTGLTPSRFRTMQRDVNQR